MHLSQIDIGEMVGTSVCIHCVVDSMTAGAISHDAHKKQMNEFKLDKK